LGDLSNKSKQQLIKELKLALTQISEYQQREKLSQEVEMSLYDSQKRYRSIIDASPMGIHMYELESGDKLIFKGANAAADKILGIDNSQFIGKTIEEAFPPLKATVVPEKYKRAAKLGEPWQTEQINYEDQKIKGAFEVYAFQTAPNAMVAIFFEITERKRTEFNLKLTQFSVDRISDAAYWMGKDAKFFYVNEAACRSLNYTREELLSMTVHDIDPNFPREAWSDHWRTVKEKRAFTIESRHKTREGKVFPVEITINYVEFKGKEYNCAFARDITARKSAEQKLVTSEEKYRQLVQFSNDAIYLLYDKKFELINEKFKEMLNVTEEYVNRPDFNLMELVAPKSRPLIEERNLKLAKGEQLSPKYLFTALSTDGKEIEVEASVTYLKYKEGIAVQGMLRDISERKNIEEKLRQAQKMEAIGTLAGGIAHDFNNILMGIQGRASLLLLQPDLPSNVVDHLKGIEEYVKSATDLTGQLLGFARGGKYQVKALNINELLKKSAMMFGRTKKEIKIYEKYQKDIWIVAVDAGQIEQVFLNLFVNAWQAMPKGGTLYLQTENMDVGQQETETLQIKSGRYVKITVTDTGIGMDEGTRQRIFDPFFTTKEMKRGTGLGLATVYGIIKNHAGYITVFSEKGKGTTFNIFLPASEKIPEEEQAAEDTIIKGFGTILLVDDERVILEVGLPILESLGYRVIVAQNGQEALDIYKVKRDQIDLVILDMVMPGLSGEEVFNQMRKINPRVKVLLSSGYSINDKAKEILDKGCSGFIQKPFNVKKMSHKITEIMGS
jgi:PAS domain S-box-containing protein